MKPSNKKTTLRSRGFRINNILGGKTLIQHDNPFKYGKHVAVYLPNEHCYSIRFQGWFKTQFNQLVELI